MTDPPAVFPLVMEEACQLIENVVNETLRSRSRYSTEWDGTEAGSQGWKANVAVTNCYAGKFPVCTIPSFCWIFPQVERKALVFIPTN